MDRFGRRKFFGFGVRRGNCEERENSLKGGDKNLKDKLKKTREEEGKRKRENEYLASKN